MGIKIGLYNLFNSSCLMSSKNSFSHRNNFLCTWLFLLKQLIKSKVLISWILGAVVELEIKSFKLKLICSNSKTLILEFS